MLRTPIWRWRRAALIALFLTAMVARPLGPLAAPTADAQAIQGPLAVDDLGPDWVLAREDVIAPPEGPALYMAAFERPPDRGLNGQGPIIVTLRVDVLPDAPPADAVDQNMAAFLAAAPPPGQVRMSEEPTVGAGALWYNFDADLSNLVPDAGASGLVYGVIFTAGNSVVNMTTLGFADHLALSDIEPIARVLASRLPGFHLG